MWRLFHQIHHSPQRVDMSGAALFHPLETVAFLVIGALVTTLVLGLDPVAAALTGYIAAFYGYFQHMNIRTPRWLGYIIQRPEAHCIHHQRDVHAYNYGDLPIWDMLFGTFRNPAGFRRRGRIRSARHESSRRDAGLRRRQRSRSGPDSSGGREPSQSALSDHEVETPGQPSRVLGRAHLQVLAEQAVGAVF